MPVRRWHDNVGGGKHTREWSNQHRLEQLLAMHEGWLSRIIGRSSSRDRATMLVNLGVNVWRVRTSTYIVWSTLQMRVRERRAWRSRASTYFVLSDRQVRTCEFRDHAGPLSTYRVPKVRQRSAKERKIQKDTFIPTESVVTCKVV